MRLLHIFLLLYPYLFLSLLLQFYFFSQFKIFFLTICYNAINEQVCNLEIDKIDLTQFFCITNNFHLPFLSKSIQLNFISIKYFHNIYFELIVYIKHQNFNIHFFTCIELSFFVHSFYHFHSICTVPFNPSQKIISFLDCILPYISHIFNFHYLHCFPLLTIMRHFWAFFSLRIPFPHYIMKYVFTNKLS